MDKIIRLTLGLLLVILIASVSYFSSGAYVEKAYRESLSATYTYTCTVTADSPLSNVTLFIPLPADLSGNSPIVTGFSSHTIAGIPASWDVGLYDTGKATLLKVTTPAITLPSGTGPNAFTLSADLASGSVIDTQDPLNNSALFRPVSGIVQVPCAPVPAKPGTPACYRYVTSLYADYGAETGAAVNITAAVTGRNSWKIFEPGSNEYTTAVTLQLSGPQHGWSAMSGTLADHIGMYDTPRITS